jgi:ketosteroid isomerase-like protein
MAEQDKEAVLFIVKEMAESMTGEQSTRHWAADVLWFDIPPFASKGVQPALKMFDSVFGTFESCKVDLLETDVMLNGNMGIVCTVQDVNRSCSTTAVQDTSWRAKPTASRSGMMSGN